MSKSSWREYQDSVENNGWRIKMIHPGDPNRVRWHPTRWSGLLFAALFLYGLFTMNLQVIFIALPCVIPALVIEMLIRNRFWRRVEADVLDVEMQRVAGGHIGQRAWATRLLCRYSLHGKTYDVTPGISGVARFIPTDASAEVIEEYKQMEIRGVRRAFVGENRVRLYVNTREPLEAKLDNGSFATRVIHSFSTNAR